LGSQPFRHFDALLKLSYPIIVQDLLKQNKGFAFFMEGGSGVRRKCCGKTEDDVARGGPSADGRSVALPTDIIAPGVLGVETLLSPSYAW
jgi:hypothetical protein